MTSGGGLGSVSAMLNSSNMNFAWGWVGVSNNRYLLAIVYTPGGGSSGQVDMATGLGMGGQQVWVANRNRPVSGEGVVELTAEGNLEVREGDGSVAWASSTRCSGPSLALQTGGNLMLLDSSGEVVWQSFDHPSDTLLPGQAISTGTQVLASVSFSNVSDGKFSVVMEQGGLIMYASTPAAPLPYKVVGFSSMDKNNTVQSVRYPSMCKGITMTYSAGGGVVIFQQKRTSSTLECNNSFNIPVGSNDNNTDVFFRLDSDGNFRTYVYRLHYGWGIDQEVFSGSLYCALPSKCGSYGVCSSHGSCSCPVATSSGSNLFRTKNPSDPTSGCALSRTPTCSNNGAGNQFVELAGANYFANDYTYQSTSSLQACKSACATSCNCSVAFYQENTRNCYHYQYVMSIQNVTDTSFHAYIKVGNTTDSPPTASAYNRSTQTSDGSSITLHNKMVILIIIVSSFIAVLCLVSFALLGIKIRKRLADMDADDAFLESLPGLPTRFSFKELNKATEGFSKKLGIGGFGSVYEGVLADGSRVAVKRLEGARQGHKEFHAEVAVLGSISHFNLVRLRGFCTQRSQCLLVYDHVTHGSLDTWLFSDSKILDWPTRYGIALDTARGLAFLHEESRERIVHLDIKPQNILLDANFIAKLCDFGLSRLIDRGESDVVTNMRGTPGYVAPEWLLQAAVTSKSDVYSYGMVLLELVSGRRNLDLSRNTFWYFPAWAVTMVEEGRMMEIVDERLQGMTLETEKEAERIIKVAMWCIQEDPNIRPCMTTVVRILEGHAEVEDAPSLLEFAMRIQSAGKVSSSSCSNPHMLITSCFTEKSSFTASTQPSNSVLSGPR
ncbi:hypothetical protein L7F22_038502 [Adiantum nelumboides]|nr:hypothetical protein [Adiantum nelumboides]